MLFVFKGMKGSHVEGAFDKLCSALGGKTHKEAELDST